MREAHCATPPIGRIRSAKRRRRTGADGIPKLFSSRRMFGSGIASLESRLRWSKRLRMTYVRE